MTRTCSICGRPFHYTPRIGRPPARCGPCVTGTADIPAEEIERRFQAARLENERTGCFRVTEVDVWGGCTLTQAKVALCGPDSEQTPETVWAAHDAPPSVGLSRETNTQADVPQQEQSWGRGVTVAHRALNPGEVGSIPSASATLHHEEYSALAREGDEPDWMDSLTSARLERRVVTVELSGGEQEDRDRIKASLERSWFGCPVNVVELRAAPETQRGPRSL